MSNMRAAMRREQAQRKKFEKKKDNKYEMAIIEGRDIGRAYAGGILINILHDQFGFGKDRLEKLLYCVSQEAPRYDQQGVRFVMDMYSNRLSKVLEPYAKIKTDVLEKIKHRYMIDYFISSCSVICSQLNEKYGFSYNQKGTGRIDKLMEYICMEFIKIENEPEKYTPNRYLELAREKTGMNIW